MMVLELAKIYYDLGVSYILPCDQWNEEWNAKIKGGVTNVTIDLFHSPMFADFFFYIAVRIIVGSFYSFYFGLTWEIRGMELPKVLRE